jgi:hypothetical protein
VISAKEASGRNMIAHTNPSLITAQPLAAEKEKGEARKRRR